MFEELNAHRQAVQENIKKAFEVGFTGNDIEKAKQWQVGDEATDKHGVTYYVHALNAAGKPLWRKKKDSGANANNSSSTGRGNNSVKSSSSEQAVDISKIPDKEFKRITNILEKQNPLEKDAPRHLEEEAMSDSELKNFLACAEHFKNDTKNINQLTRYRCSEWAKLAKSELDNRQQSKKAKSTDVTQKNSAVDAKVKPSSKKNPSELETISEVEDYAKSISGVTFKSVKSGWGDKGAKAFELTYPHGGKLLIDFLNNGEYVYKLTDSNDKTIISTNSTDETSHTDWSIRLNPDKLVSRRVEVLKTKLTKLKGEATKARNKMIRDYSSFSDKYAYQKASEAVSDMKTKIQKLQSLIGTF